jgi:hypothetical protein
MAVRLNKPYMPITGVGGAVAGDNPPTIWSDPSLDAPQTQAPKQYVPGYFGPEDTTQGPFGRDLSASQPLWARYIDATQQQQGGGAGSSGKVKLNPQQDSFQPGSDTLTTAGLPPGISPSMLEQVLAGLKRAR